MPDRSYDVTALEFPIVYTLDGDHDRNGLLYAPTTLVPILQWVRDEWRRDDEWLPEAHRRQQLITMLVDGLRRYEEMERLLRTTLAAHGDLLAHRGEVIVADAVEEDAQDPAIPPVRREIEQHYRTTVNELATILDELTDGEVREVHRDPTERARWRARWIDADTVLRGAIADRLVQIDKLYATTGRALLAQQTGLAATDVDRLVLNDFIADLDVAAVAPAQVAARGSYDRVNPLRPLPAARPLVLRAREGETVEVTLRNEVRSRHVGLHRQGSGLVGGVREADGAAVGLNPSTTAAPRGRITYRWTADTEGVWPLNDLADVRGTEDGTNVHGLFGVLLVEPPGATWRDPETGEDVTGSDLGCMLDVDVYPTAAEAASEQYVDLATDGDHWRPHREFTIFIHDEPEVHSALHVGGGEHTVMPLSYRAEPMPNRLPHRMRQYAADTRRRDREEENGTGPGWHRRPDTSPHELRAVKREINTHTLAEEFWVGRRADGSWIERVAGEEQHHSSWLFGDPVTSILRAYQGDPCRVRLVHAGIKETHVFHLHVHQWHAVPTDTAVPSTWRPGEPRGSQLLDSITIGPQTGFTIDPLYGSGSRQRAVGDIIWHCHLYPHFHHGMWGLWRSFDRFVDGERNLPDGSPCPRLVALEGNEPEQGDRVGFPWFVDAGVPQKAPPPPAAAPDQVGGRRRLLALRDASPEEEAAFAPGADQRPGAPFVALDAKAHDWAHAAGVPAAGRVISYDVAVREERLDYNRIGWHDHHGHFYELGGVSTVVGGVRTSHPLPTRSGPREPFFVRANHGDVVELRLHNELGTIGADHFDVTQLPVECGLHVHLVKFDVLAADGSSTGWNYLSGASCREAVPGVGDVPLPANVSLHRWVVDEEFGPCFFHDHLLANYRQKRGLFAALIAEPPGAEWTLGPALVEELPPVQGAHAEQDAQEDDERRAEGPLRPGLRGAAEEDADEVPAPSTEEDTAPVTAWIGASAIVEPLDDSDIGPFREACLGVGDFVPLYDRAERPLNPPGELSGDDDPGTMAVNYRSAPLTARGPDPAQWFATDERRRERKEEPEPGDEEELGQTSWLRDPETPIVPTYPGERLRIRLIQGSHEEQHSFVAHGLRWRREWQRDAHHPDGTASTLVNQQTLGISEAFTLDINGDGTSPYDIGDHLWRFSAMDDLWLGCWGLVRVLVPGSETPQLPGTEVPSPSAWRPECGERYRWYTVRARRIEHEYDGRRLTDPYGLVYEALADGEIARGTERDEATATVSPFAESELRTKESRPGKLMMEPWVDGVWRVGPEPGAAPGPEPLVLRCRPGQWVRVCLVNEVSLPRDGLEARDGWTGRHEDPLLPRFGPEPHPPALPLDEDRRTVSPRVSLHPALLQYDVITDDGAYVGTNRDSTVRPLPLEDEHGHGPDDGAVAEHDGHGHDRQNWRCYWWYADPELGKDIGQVCYLHDMADIRNHRHHGLVGAIIVEPEGWEPDDWTGPRTTVRGPGGETANEQVLFWHDGLRHYAFGDLTSPVADVVPGDDPEDAGQKGINYRCRPVHPRTQLHETPPTPTWEAEQGDTLWLRLVGACDKPRNHTFTVHGQQWPMAPWLGRTSPQVGGLSGLTADVVHDIAMKARHAGDHAYRSGAFRWAVTQGMWGILRVGKEGEEEQ
ncbi:multicopper oxidase domain-containing protein [Actinomycetospora chibensis]|uniref:Multicopper oxidase domain-containing protein n=1 Tax=Actinomycetospora chibensis TaxID=663606 RepID=A0ABV9RKK1_9PSEU|nr:multicopper oxidase domain-containing protein [Actinomycetospora chibensis]MDD7926126.1 multicopper oxidase domain-containing protein [Actinomycetospora chibensis]